MPTNHLKELAKNADSDLVALEENKMKEIKAKNKMYARKCRKVNNISLSV